MDRNLNNLDTVVDVYRDGIKAVCYFLDDKYVTPREGGRDLRWQIRTIGRRSSLESGRSRVTRAEKRDLLGMRS